MSNLFLCRMYITAIVRYRHGVRWFGLIIIFRRILIGTAGFLFHSDRNYILVFCALLLMFSGFITERMRPFRFKIHMLVENVSLFLCSSFAVVLAIENTKETERRGGDVNELSLTARDASSDTSSSSLTSSTTASTVLNSNNNLPSYESSESPLVGLHVLAVYIFSFFIMCVAVYDAYYKRQDIFYRVRC